MQGKRATTHWMSMHLLEPLGATPVYGQRVVRDGDVFTGGGVTAGIDFALTVAAEARGTNVLPNPGAALCCLFFRLCFAVRCGVLPRGVVSRFARTAWLHCCEAGACRLQQQLFTGVRSKHEYDIPVTFQENLGTRKLGQIILGPCFVSLIELIEQLRSRVPHTYIPQ